MGRISTIAGFAYGAFSLCYVIYGFIDAVDATGFSCEEACNENGCCIGESCDVDCDSRTFAMNFIQYYGYLCALLGLVSGIGGCLAPVDNKAFGPVFWARAVGIYGFVIVAFTFIHLMESYEDCECGYYFNDDVLGRPGWYIFGMFLGFIEGVWAIALTIGSFLDSKE